MSDIIILNESKEKCTDAAVESLDCHGFLADGTPVFLKEVKKGEGPKLINEKRDQLHKDLKIRIVKEEADPIYLQELTKNDGPSKPESPEQPDKE